MGRKDYYEFRPYNVGRWIVWGAFALLLAVAPILPYLFLVLILIFRPRGLLGTREG